MKRGASLNAKSQTGDTAIMYAVREGHDGVVRKLLSKPDNGGKVSNAEGDNILTLAIKLQDPLPMLRAIKDSKSSGISPSIKKDGVPVLLWAISNNESPEVIKILMDWYHPPKTILSVKDDYRQNIEYYAKQYDNYEVLEHIEWVKGK